MGTSKKNDSKVFWKRVGGGVAPSVLPHHRAYGSVHGGSCNALERWRLTQQLFFDHCFVFRHSSRLEFSFLAVTFDTPFQTLADSVRYLPGGIGGGSPSFCILCHRKSGSSLALHVQAFSPVEGPTMPSADFCPPIPPPYGVGSSWQADRPPRVMRSHLHAYARRIYARAFRAAIGL